MKEEEIQVRAAIWRLIGSLPPKEALRRLKQDEDKTDCFTLEDYERKAVANKLLELAWFIEKRIEVFKEIADRREPEVWQEARKQQILKQKEVKRLKERAKYFRSNGKKIESI